MRRQGYGKGYRYAHDDPAASREMACLPEGLRGRKYWEDVESGVTNKGESGVRSQESE
jgi:replication-associated recombination protein RarA